MGEQMRSDSPPAAGETIGERLKRLRLDRGFSQRELAAPGVSYAYISRIEAGTRQPSVKALRRLAVKLNVSADYLERGSDLDPEAERELRLSDLELAIRLGEWDGDRRSRCRRPSTKPIAAGDRAATLRGRVASRRSRRSGGSIPGGRAARSARCEDEPFVPVERFDIYANLGRAYTEAGRPQDAVDLFESAWRRARATAMRRPKRATQRS